MRRLRTGDRVRVLKTARGEQPTIGEREEIRLDEHWERVIPDLDSLRLGPSSPAIR